MSNAPRKPPREYDITDDKKLMLWGAPLTADAFPIRLKFGVDDDNQILMEIDSGTKTEKNFPIKVEAPMSLPNFRQLMSLIERVATFKGGGVAFECDIKGHPWIYDRAQGKNIKSKEALLVAQVLVEKRDNGQVLLKVTAPKKPEMRFEFAQNDYLTTTQNGSAVPLAFSSQETAVAWATGWRDILTAKLERVWKEPDYQRNYRLQKAAENAQRHGGGGGGAPRPQHSAPAAAPAQTQAGSDVFDDDVFF